VIRDFTLDSGEKSVIIHDDRLAKLFYYDFKGNHLRTESTRLRFQNLCKFDNKMYYYLGSADNKHLKILENYNLLEEKDKVFQKLSIPVSNPKILYSQFDQFYYSGNHLSFTVPVVKNSIYQINKKGVSLKYKLDFGEKSMNTEKLNKLEELVKKMSCIQGGIKLDVNLFTGKHFETKTKLYIRYVENGEFREVLYNKNNGSYLVYKKFKSNDRFSIGDLKPIYAIYDEDVFIGIREASDFTRYQDVVDKFNKTKELKALCKELKEQDNPVLCFYKLNNFNL
jgi:hypothetical protein